MDGRSFPTLLTGLVLVACRIDPIGAAPSDTTSDSGGGPDLPATSGTGAGAPSSSATTVSSSSSGGGGGLGPAGTTASSSGSEASTGVGGEGGNGGGGAPPVDECAEDLDDCLEGERCTDLPEGFDCSPLSILILVESEPSRAVGTGLEALGANAVEGPGFSAWDGSNPPLDGMDAVVWFQGVEHPAQMPNAGQVALAAFVQAGGGLVRTEWAAFYSGSNLGPADVMLPVTFLSSFAAGNIWNRGVPGHPIGAALPDSFNEPVGYWSNVSAVVGATVVWASPLSLPLVVTSDASGGRVVYVNHAATYSATTPVDLTPEALRIFVDAALFAAR